MIIPEVLRARKRLYDVPGSTVRSTESSVMLRIKLFGVVSKEKDRYPAALAFVAVHPLPTVVLLRAPSQPFRF